MRKFILILVVGLLLSGNAYTKETNIECDLSKYTVMEDDINNSKQIPLSALDPSQRERKVTIIFDLDNEKFLGSSLIGKTEYKKVLFTDDKIYFVTKGFKSTDIMYYDTILDRLTGELIRTIKPTKKYLQIISEYEIDNGTSLAYEQTTVYQCKVMD